MLKKEYKVAFRAIMYLRGRYTTQVVRMHFDRNVEGSDLCHASNNHPKPDYNIQVLEMPYGRRESYFYIE